MRLTKTLLVIAPPNVLRDLPHAHLLDSGYFVAGAATLGEAINVAGTFVSNQIVVDARALEDVSDILKGLKTSRWTMSTRVRICRDCTSWSQLEPLLKDVRL